MEHYFQLPVSFKGEEKSFYGRLVTFAYDYKFFVNVDGQEIIFEPDNERNLRALDERTSAKLIDIDLVKQIGNILEKLRLQY